MRNKTTNITIAALALWLTGCAIAPGRPATRTPDVLSVQMEDGQSIAYRTAGTHNAGTPIVLIHGVADSSESWIPIAADLGRTHPVYAIDLAGYGFSERPPEYDVSLSAQATYLNEFLDKLGIERATLVGHDIGGGVAQILAARNPARVARLVLINSAIDDNWPAFEIRMLRIPLLSYVSLTLMERPLWEHVIRKGFHQRALATDAVIDRHQHWYQGAAGRQRLVRNAQALDNTDLTEWSDTIRALPVPTLILWGREDAYLDAAAPEELCREMRRCELRFIEDAGHFVMDEQPRNVAVLIGEFVTD